MDALATKKLLISSALAASLLTAQSAFPFHDGGVANCDGCHTMHNSSKNFAVTKNGTPVGTANAYLLLGSDPSSTCLICHAGSSPTDSYKVATTPPPGFGSPPLQLTPGGDFAYLQKRYDWVNSVGAAKSSPGGNHGHSITAADFLYFGSESRYPSAPGGSYPTSGLGCTSCHDPHGNYRILDAGGNSIATSGKPIGASGSHGNLPTEMQAVGSYRMLAGRFYQPASLSGNHGFVNDPPSAVAPAVYNRNEATSDTRVAYGRGMSEWCGNCHAGLHHRTLVEDHPSGNGASLNDFAATYNAYVKTGDLTNTDLNKGYSSLVPFEEGITDLATLTAQTAKTSGASSADNVMCLTCHRAHASAWDGNTRWNTANDVYLTVAGNYPGIDAPTPQGQQGEYATGKTMAEYQQSMYGRPSGSFAQFQLSLCSKCHGN